jgi:hypothetical protein
LVRVSNRPYVAPNVMVQYLMDLFDYMSILCKLMGAPRKILFHCLALI